MSEITQDMGEDFSEDYDSSAAQIGKIDYLTKDGFLLVMFVSVVLLQGNIKDANRIIEMTSYFSR